MGKDERPVLSTTFRFTVYLVASVFAAMLGLWVGDRSVPFEVVEMEALKPVQPGGDLEVTYRVNRFRSCDRQVFREIIDGEGYRHILGIQRPTPARLGYDAYTVRVTLPLALQSGLGQYRVAIEDYCNPFHYLWPIVSYYETPILILAASPKARSPLPRPTEAAPAKDGHAPSTPSRE